MVPTRKMEKTRENFEWHYLNLFLTKRDIRSVNWNYQKFACEKIKLLTTEGLSDKVCLCFLFTRCFCYRIREAEEGKGKDALPKLATVIQKECLECRFATFHPNSLTTGTEVMLFLPSPHNQYLLFFTWFINQNYCFLYKPREMGH